ncbi:MAG: conjugal transfer protein TrbL [Gammaproteobacteria bacterium]|jgi:type IV secretion system protein TrbL|nr:conjugal transfer protein TrbL [Gammaproteobacteria bacterium]
MALDVTSFNAVQAFFLENTVNAFSSFMVYARHLLYYFISFEVLFAGLGWMLYQNQVAERLFFQILKIGLILFLVENYNSILNAILSSSIQLGQKLGQGESAHVLLNPGLVWEYGYNFAVSLLQSAATAEGFAFPMILLCLGFGILLVVGIFGIQILLQLAAFYLVAAISLIFLPLSVFSPLKDFFSRSMQSILQASIRLMVQMLIVSAALGLWAGMRLQSFTPAMNINVPLGFLFSGMLFVFASAYLPKLAERVVGMFRWEATAASNAQVSSAASLSMPSISVTASSGLSPALTAITAQDSLAKQAPVAAASVSAGPGYVNALKEDFLARQKTETSAGIAGFALKEKIEEQRRRDDIKKIKQAFYEVMKEVVEKD